MIAKSVFAYLEPYLPYQIVYGISMAAFFFEKFILPKIYQLYSNASLDPKTLIPFVISAIALYLSIVSIYHAFRAAFRMVWFLIKWSIVIVLVWLALAIFNDFRNRSEGGHRIGRDILEEYQKSLHSWWESAGWNLMNFKDQLGFDPLPMVFGHGFLSVFEPFFNNFQQQNQHTTSSFNFDKRSFSQSRNQNTFDQTKSKKRPSNDAVFSLPELLHRFWVQSVQTPIQTIVKQSRSKSRRSQTQSETVIHNR